MNNATFMRVLVGLSLLLSFPLLTLAQSLGDTVVIQTFSYSDPAPASVYRGSFEFPDASESFQKILMSYSLKCDPSTRADQYGCGEWDYLTYAFVTDSAGVMDSVRRTTPNYRFFNNSAPDSVPLSLSPIYDFYQDWQKNRVFTGASTRDSAILGAGAMNSFFPFGSQNTSSKSQYLWRVSELSAANLTAGDITALRMDLSALGDELRNLTIRMKHTLLDSLDENAVESGNFQTVYRRNTSFAVTGWQSLNLLQPFTWNGTANIVVEFSFTNKSSGSGNEITSDATPFPSGVITAGQEHYLDFDGPDFVEIVNEDFNLLDQEVTVSFWQYGDPDRQPQNDYAFEGRNAANQRVLGSHLPWSNSNVFWDAGNEGSGYDRISKLAVPSEFEGQWNHWAFTKDAVSGEMKMFLNGQLWHSGNGMTNSMAGITRFRIGSATADGNNQYDGYIDEFRIWNKALDAATISNWMHKDVDLTHPFFSNLLSYYQFNEGSGLTANDAAGGNGSGILIGSPDWKVAGGDDLFRNFQSAAQRPRIIFDKTAYTSMLDSTLVIDSVAYSPNHIQLYQNPGGGFIIRHDAPNQPSEVTDTLVYWPAGIYTFTYDQNGNKIDSVFISPDNTLYRNDHVWYSNIVRYEIGRYITPYGINLDMGPDGRTWYFDVTDYAPILRNWIYLQAGNNQELLDLKFLFIKGTPPRDVRKIQKMYDGSFTFNSMVNGNNVAPLDLPLDPGAEMFRVKTRTSGHGFGGGAGTNCSEFCRRKHSVWVNGNKEFEWWLWNECAYNPLQPQGGTWIYDRAGWCPGDAVYTYDHELTPLVKPGDTVNLDYEADAAGQTPEGNWVLRAQLISYGPPNHTLDVSLDDIIRPSDKDSYGHYNPICDNPIVKISNQGSTKLTSALITYGVVGGFKPCYYRWSGNLDFLESEEVELPLFNWTGLDQSNPRFFAEVSYPNFTQDGYMDNNHGETGLIIPPQYKDGFVVELRTNRRASENLYQIINDQGLIVFQKSFLSNNTTYSDTMSLSDGCYTFLMTDQGQDGIDFFVNRATAGTGSLRFYEPNGTLIKTFAPDFGAEVRQQFTIGYNMGQEFFDIQCENITAIDDGPGLEDMIQVYPNPATDKLFLDLELNDAKDVEISLFDAMGKRLLYQTKPEVRVEKFSLDLPYPSGIYFVKVKAGSLEYSETVVVRK